MIKRRMIQGLLILALLCGAVLLAHPSAAWAEEVTATKPDQGDGSAENPYQIENAGELYWFAGLVNGDASIIGDEMQKNTAACAELTGDIVLNKDLDLTKFAVDNNGTLTYGGSQDISFDQWTPIGNDYDYRYTGTFDGKGHTISGLYINSNARYAGLFGCIGSGGTVKNLTLANSYISGTGNTVGGICGRSDDGSSIENCDNSGTVTGTGSNIVGGICGVNYGDSIENCDNSGDVTVTGSDEVGGICGVNYGDGIKNCDNSGDVTVTGSDEVGGICGYNAWGRIENCSNIGTVTGSGEVGGICGQNGLGSISDCDNSGAVTGSSEVGGICGDNGGSITSCSNGGNVTGSGEVGGICGDNGGSITNCSNGGNVTGTGSGDYVGGICGDNDGTVTNCSNSGPVTGSGEVGGICGENSYDPFYGYGGSITNCYWLETAYTGEGVGVNEAGATVTKVLSKTKKAYESGKVAWLLNQWQDDGLDLDGKVWAVGDDGYPVLNGESNNIIVKLTFNANTGNAADNFIRYANAGAAFPSVKKPERAGYTFVGWNTAADGSGTSALEITLDADITLYAQWEKAVYTVTLHANGGTINSGNVTNYTYGTETPLPTTQDITRAGYTFAGWYDNEALSGEPETVIPANATGEKTYYAKWTANTYKVTLHANGGTIADGKNVTNYTYGTETTLPTDVTCAGYTFAGWYEDEALSGEPETVIPADVTGDKEYWAKWTAKSYPSAPPTVSEKVIAAIKAADPGETVTVDLSSGSTKLDKEVFETLAGRDVTLVVDLGDGVSWTVNGTDIPEDADFTDIDMGVTMNSDGIPVEVVNAITGERSSVQITLAHDGAFGFTMTLTAPLGEENAGYWANLYYFNESTNKMTFETAAPIGSDGSVSLALSHASQYAIVIDDHNHGVVTLPFTDVSEGDWFYDPVRYVYSQGLMTGTSATTFEPNTSLSRAMLVAVLHRLEGSPAASAGDFTDVAEGDWYAEAVNWAASVGIVNGFDDGTFQPNAAITREQLAAILRNYAAYKGLDVTATGDLSTYSDAASVSAWAKESVAWAVDQGLISGMTVNTLQPQGLSTRAQVAAVLQRYLAN